MQDRNENKSRRGAKPNNSSKPNNPRKGKGGQRGAAPKRNAPMPKFSEDVRLNKYIANLGICSRREADVLIATGVVSVNGEIVTEMGYKVKPGDVVKYDGATVKPEKKVYVLLNKPKDFAVSKVDYLDKKSVYSLIKKATRDQMAMIDPIDKVSKGLVLFTNDQDLLNKFHSPTIKVHQVLQITLNKAFEQEHVKVMTETGVLINQSRVTVEKLSILTNKGDNEIGVEFRAQKHKSIYNSLEKLGYQVLKVDRVGFASLTKKDLPRGVFRHLTEKEVAFLKML
jgi:23S rRNA pseudouridine2605 synthase